MTSAKTTMSDVANTLKASGKGGGRTNDHEQTMVVSIAQNQRGELREANVTPALSTGGVPSMSLIRRFGAA